ncbi:hypothetical protein HPP92_001408 [Vanilla planifolia]|uniref:C2H2-type domain-containing protein n=1 Tax=Vanilla planifolia TaxID=51239 RepID=A0A835RU78_VANPL|nr:hypothetical protein HPP92_001564 [Vanilla planifolia]KAG0501336.1 hypothetical protein HPP92_001408 [Vanilla planifolia]
MVVPRLRPSFLLLLSHLLMALTSFLSTTSTSSSNHHKRKKHRHRAPPPPPPKHPTVSSWEHIKTILSCKTSSVNDPSPSSSTGKSSTLGSRCGSSLRDTVSSGTRVVNRPDTDHGSAGDSGHLSCASNCSAGDTQPLNRRRPPRFVSSGSARGGIHLMRLSGCYECRAVDAEPASRYPRPRTLCACPQCGEVFTKADSLELHQTLRHAVSELGPEDTGRNIVEIIFKSSWQKKDHPICKIERILKVHNTARTVARFEDYRNAVKARAHFLHSSSVASDRFSTATRREPRCAADGNELLRFYCTSLFCHLGAAASTSLCHASSPASAAPCGVCSVIRHGFPRPQHPLGVCTTASSGRAHNYFSPLVADEGRRAMLVCRVIAGRIHRSGEEEDGGGGFGVYDSVAGEGTQGPASLEELFVANPRAILPCFVVVYRTPS